MAGWNRPSAGQPVTKKGGAKVPSKVKGIVAGLVAVCALGGLCVWMFSGGDDAPEREVAKKPAKIKEVKPAPAPTNAVAAAPASAPIDKSKLSPAWQKYYDGRDTNKWMVVYNPITKREYISRKVEIGLTDRPPPLYAAHALNILDAIACIPATSIMANVRIDDRFMKSLQNGFAEKIEILPDDSDEIKARKESMISIMDDLRARLKAGENIQQVIEESLADRNRVATFRQEMMNEQARMFAAGASDDELDDFVELCNKKLTEKGGAPIRSRRETLEALEAVKREREEGKKQ